MAQEFRIFTQRVTKTPTLIDRILNQGETELFNVRAKTLVDQLKPPIETRAIIQKMYRSSRKVFGIISPLYLHRQSRFQLVHFEQAHHWPCQPIASRRCLIVRLTVRPITSIGWLRR